MANLNKVMLIGRLTRDPEVRMFSSGGKVASFGFAVNNKKKDPQTGQWVDDPCFLDCDAFNKGEFGKLADLIEQYLHKGNQAYIEGHLKLDQWNDKTTGDKRQKIKIVVDNVQFLEPRRDGQAPAPRRQDSGPPPSDYDPGPPDAGEPMSPPPPGPADKDIPF